MTSIEERLLDPVTMEVFSNRLLSITEDMGNLLIRASFSTNIKERRDCSVGLFHADGRLIAQAAHIPLHLGSLMGGVEAVLRRWPVERMREGDAFMCNDPYLAGGTHMPDVTIVTPIFHNGSVRFFAANIAHHSDFGGSVPGSIAGSSPTVFQEGLRLPVIRLVRAGELDEDLLYLVAHNTREPEERMLDLEVQVATNRRGAELMTALIDREGIETVERSVEDILTYTRRRLRNRIAALADGEYTGEAWLDDDGQGGDPVPVRVTARVAGDRLTLDFSGSGPQARGALNMVESALNATVCYAIKALLDPELMPNSGIFEAVEIDAPAGTIVNPRFPGAVGARSITCNKASRAIFAAFSGLLPPERVMAAGHDSVPAIVFSGTWRDRPGTYVYLETIGGGAGARRDADGMNAVHVHMTNTTNLPVEALEHEYPLRVDEYALVEDSGGAGRRRGGLGIARQIRALADDVIFSIRSDGHILGAPGVLGGLDGGTAALIRNHGTPSAEHLSSKVSHVAMKRDESMRIETGGGGGFGPPSERAAADLARDIRGGYVSREAAARDYGAEKVGEALRLDCREASSLGMGVGSFERGSK